MQRYPPPAFRSRGYLVAPFMSSRCFMAASRRPDLFGSFPFLRFFIMAQVPRGLLLPAPGLLQWQLQVWTFSTVTISNGSSVLLIQRRDSRRYRHWRNTSIILMNRWTKSQKKGRPRNLLQQLLRSNSGSLDGSPGRQPLHCPARITSHRWMDFYQLHMIYF